MNIVFKAQDEISSCLNNIGNNGRQVVAGLEEKFVRANSAMSQAAKSISGISAELSSFSGGFIFITSLALISGMTACGNDKRRSFRSTATAEADFQVQ